MTVHRMDAADAVHAAGGRVPEPIAPRGAVDGIGVDSGTGWMVRFADDGSGCDVAATALRSQLDATDALLTGTPEALLLACWCRRPLATLEVRGDRGLAETFHDTLRF